MRWLQPLARIVGVAASLGALATIYAAAGAWSGRYAKMAGHPMLLLLFVGIFVVWFPTVLMLRHMTRGAMSRDTLKVALRHASPSMRRLVYGAWIYCGLVWAVSMIGGILTKGRTIANEGVYFTAFMLVFYVTALGVSASALAMTAEQVNPRCARGHPVGVEAQFCQTCGARVVGAESDGG